LVKEHDIREVVKNFKKENGNTKISTSDMIIYLVERLDKLPCETHMNTIAELKGKLNLLIPILLAMFGFVIGLIYFLNGA